MPESYLSRAEALAANGQIGEAIELLEEAVESDRETAGIAKLLAKLSLRINEVRAFQNWCHEALRMDPKDLEVYEMMEAYFRSVGRDFEADEVREVAQNISQRG
jgi:tetratricopeptide (TPR) repeat protein